MSMRALPCLLALVLGVGAALLVSCGGTSGQIPAGDASQLKGHLDQVDAAVAQRNCPAADSALQQARRDLASLDNKGTAVDGRLRSRLRDGVEKLDAQANMECEQDATTTTTTVATTTTEVPTQTAPPEPVPTQTETTSVPTAPTEPPTDTTTVPVPPVSTTTTPKGTGGITPDPGALGDGGNPPGNAP